MTDKNPTSFNWFLLILLSMAQFMVVLDFSIVNVALPVIQKEFNFTQENLQWIVTAYSLAFGGLLLLGGRLADLYGRKLIFLIGLILFSIVSFIGGLANSQLMLIIARAVQGIGAALILPAAMSLITTHFVEEKARQQALSVFGAVGSSGFAAGVLLGGVLTATLGWRWILFVNVPIGFITALLSLKYVKQLQAPMHVKLDILGALTITSGLALFVYAVTVGGNIGFTSPLVIFIGILAVLLIVAFIFIESKTENPLIPLGIFKISSLRGANLSVFLSQAAFAANLLLLAEYLQGVLKYSVLLTGLMFLPMGVIVFIMSSFVAPKLMDKFGLKKVIAVGLAITAVGFLLLSRVPVDGTYIRDVLPGIALIAFGFGASFPGLLIASVAGVDSSAQGLASGLINTSRQIGASVGVALLVAIVESKGGPSISVNAFALDVGIEYALTAGFFLIVLSTITSIVFIEEKSNNSA